MDTDGLGWNRDLTQSMYSGLRRNDVRPYWQR